MARFVRNGLLRALKGVSQFLTESRDVKEAVVLRTSVVTMAVVAALIVGVLLRPEFFDLPSLLLTLGGAVTVTSFSYSKRQLRDLLRAIRELFLDRRETLQDHLDELARLTRLFHLEGLRGLENQERYLQDPFLMHGVGMLIDLHSEEKIHARLEHALESVLNAHEISRQILLTLGKLLPSFGLIGTLIGMVLLLKNISGQDPQSLPSALGLAVLTTLYGAFFANVVVAPLAARLHSVAVEQETRMRLTIDWVILRARGEGATNIASKLGALLPPVEDRASRGRDWAPIALSTPR